jgi:hypothetical protein
MHLLKVFFNFVAATGAQTTWMLCRHVQP